MTSSPDQRRKEAKLYLAERAARNPALTPPITYCNSTTTGTLKAIVMQSGRGAEADQHRNFFSAPMAAQIVRA